MAGYLFQYESYSSNKDLQDELYSLCELIGDAEDSIRSGMLDREGVAIAKLEIAQWRARVREAMNVDTSWEPDNGDWRMGCY